MSQLSTYIESLLKELQEVDVSEPIVNQGLEDIIPLNTSDELTSIDDSDVLSVQKLKQAAAKQSDSRFKLCPDAVWGFINEHLDELGIKNLSADEALDVLEQKLQFGDIDSFKGSDESQVDAKKRLSTTNNCQMVGDLVIMLV